MSPAPDLAREALLTHYLRQPLAIRFVNRKVFTAGLGSKDEVVTSSRLILILSGKMTYTMEDQVFHLTAGTQFFVPAWIRRVWTVPPKNTCEIAWCEFEDDSLEAFRGGCVRRKLAPAAFAREKRGHLEVLRLYQKIHDTEHPALVRLGLEALLKAALARFWMEAEIQAQSHTARSKASLHPTVKQALRWMENHYHERDALEALYRECDLTPNYFRKHFKDSMQCSPQEYLQRLRLRHARHLIHSTSWQQKRIANEVGFDDPLYFSRLYTRFWGHSPSQERASTTTKPTSVSD